MYLYKGLAKYSKSDKEKLVFYIMDSKYHKKLIRRSVFEITSWGLIICFGFIAILQIIFRLGFGFSAVMLLCVSFYLIQSALLNLCICWCSLQFYKKDNLGFCSIEVLQKMSVEITKLNNMFRMKYFPVWGRDMTTGYETKVYVQEEQYKSCKVGSKVEIIEIFVKEK